MIIIKQLRSRRVILCRLDVGDLKHLLQTAQKTENFGDEEEKLPSEEKSDDDDVVVMGVPPGNFNNADAYL